MLSHWLSSWYTTQPQSQEPFNDQYEATEGEWVEVLPPIRQQETNEPIKEEPTTNGEPLAKEQDAIEKPEDPIEQVPIAKDEPNQVAATKQEEKSVMKPEPEVTKQEEPVPKPNEEPVKRLSRQERRAEARRVAREKRKQPLNSALKKKIMERNCLLGNRLVFE
jgi:hypothetical protein